MVNTRYYTDAHMLFCSPLCNIVTLLQKYQCRRIGPKIGVIAVMADTRFFCFFSAIDANQPTPDARSQPR